MGITGLIVSVNDWINANRQIVLSALKITAIVMGVGITLIGLCGIITALGITIAGVVAIVGAVGSALAVMMVSDGEDNHSVDGGQLFAGVWRFVGRKNRIAEMKRTLNFVLAVVISVIGGFVAVGYSDVDQPLMDFEAASPTKGLWKGWPVGTTVTFQRTLTNHDLPVAVQFYRLMLVGRSAEGYSVIAFYGADKEGDPWKFGGTGSNEYSGILRDCGRGVETIAERTDTLLIDGTQIECVVRKYAGVRETPLKENVEGEEWTIGPDGPGIKSSVTSSYELEGTKDGYERTMSCGGREKLKVGTNEFNALKTMEVLKNGEQIVGGNTYWYWSSDVPGWFMGRQCWNQTDEQQPPIIDEKVIAFGHDAELLARYLKIDRPAELERLKL